VYPRFAWPNKDAQLGTLANNNYHVKTSGEGRIIDVQRVKRNWFH
jgi:hypothetical protein